MPSATGNPTPGASTKESTSKRQNTVVGEDELNVLDDYRNRDTGVVYIKKPTTRLLSNAIKIPHGSVRPTNTLSGTAHLAGSHPKRAAKGIHKGRIYNPLDLETSRGQNVKVIPYAPITPEEFVDPPSKRQKTAHQAIHSSRSSSVDELLDYVAEAVNFIPSQRSSQDQSIRSLNSQGSGPQMKKIGPFSEHRNLERMMDSTPGKKGKRKTPQHHGLPSSPELSTVSTTGNIAGCHNLDLAETNVHTAPRSPYKGTARQPTLNSRALKVNSSDPVQSLSTGNRSPYFDQPLMSAHHTNGTSNQQNSKTHNEHGHDGTTAKLADTFIATDGKRRGSDPLISSDIDELQLGTTVGLHPDEKALSSIQRSRKSSPSKASLDICIPAEPSEDMELDPSTIRPTRFESMTKHSGGARSDGGRPRERKAPWAIGVAAVSTGGEIASPNDMALVHDEKNGSYVLMRDGRPLPVSVQLQKLQKIFWAPSSHKVRFMSSKTGTEDNVIDLEFRKEKDVADLVGKLQLQAGCKTPSFDSEHMNKMFEKKRMESKKSLSFTQPMRSARKDVQRADSSRLTSKVEHRSNSPDLAQLKQKHQKVSIVEQLRDRAFSKDAIPTEILGILQPNNDGLPRRSTRASAGLRKSTADLFEDDEALLMENKYSKVHGLGDPWKKPLTYPKVGKKKTTVDFSDLERLDEGEFLNDNLISFYLRFLEHTLEEQRPDVAKRVYFFNTFFFATLMNTHKGKKGFNYEGVQKWTRNVDLFTYDYIVVPINESTHWYLAVICNLPSLDRDLTLSDDSPSSPAGAISSAADPKYGLPPSSSPAQPVEGDSVNLIDDGREPDEKGARDSFAGMSLEADGEGPNTDNPTSEQQEEVKAPSVTDEDREMLDVQLHELLPASSTLPDTGKRVGQDVANSTKDPEGISKAASYGRKGKRKSMPPVTKTDPTKPIIITFDSLGLSRSPTVRILKDYLREEAKVKRGGMEFDAGQIKGITASMIPQQDNFYDCGVFLLGYVAKLLEKDPRDFIAKIILRELDPEKDWPNLRPSQLRSSIRGQVMKLHNDQMAERNKERSAQKASKHGAIGTREVESSPTRRLADSKKPPQTHVENGNDAAEGETEPPASIQPQTRNQALEIALSIETQNLDEDSRKGADDSRGADRNIDPALLRNTKIIEETSHLKYPSSGKAEERSPSRDEPSVILVESQDQSQQDLSAPKSARDTQPNHSIGATDAESPELPAEIQDSQPSQTSRAFADILQKESDEAKKTASFEEVKAVEIPVVRLEASGNAKRKAVGPPADPTDTNGNGNRAEDSKHSTKMINTNIPNWGNQGNQRTKRRKAGRKATRDDEIINIDDD